MLFLYSLCYTIVGDFMNKNFDKMLEEIIDRNATLGFVPRVLLHSCCAPCSSYVIEYLSKYFYLTIFYYNPNISPFEEYSKRKEEQIRLINMMDTKYKVNIITKLSISKY